MSTITMRQPDSIQFRSPARGTYDFKKIQLNDPRVYSLLSSGKTVGCFQVESQLGQLWCRKVKPTNISELSDVISLTRPGASESGASDTYIRRRNGEEEITYIHPALEPILKNTYGVLLYQESCLRIAKDIAGFDDAMQRKLLKGLGKKDTQVISALKEVFANGCVKKGIVNKEQAEEIFSWIQKFQRYGFNKCLDPYTQVVTPTGIKKLKDLVVGDEVAAPLDLDNKTKGFVKVKEVIHNGKKILWTLVADGKRNTGYSIVCTMDHKFLCDNGKIKSLYNILLDGNKICVADGLVRIHSVTEHGLSETMDIEVDSNLHLFYGDDFAVSNSHGVEYALVSYATAFQKVHFPTEFICAALSFAENKPDPKEEVYKLVCEAKLMDVEVGLPCIVAGNHDFKISAPRHIRFGLTHIRNIGSSAAKTLTKLNKELNTWGGFVKNIRKIKRNVAESLIKSGACDTYGLSRVYMLDVVHLLVGFADSDEETKSVYAKLTDNEFSCFFDYFNTAIAGVPAALQTIIDKKGCITKRSGTILSKIAHYQNKTSKLQDTNRQRAIWEKIYLGMNLSCSIADDVKNTNKEMRVFTCKEVIKSINIPQRPQPNADGNEGWQDRNKNKFVIHVVIDKINEKRTGEQAKTPNAKYCYLDVSDRSGAIKGLVVWPKLYNELKSPPENTDIDASGGGLKEESVIEVHGRVDTWKDRIQYIADKIQIIG